jgi:hypothetical protein
MYIGNVDATDYFLSMAPGYAQARNSYLFSLGKNKFHTILPEDKGLEYLWDYNQSPIYFKNLTSLEKYSVETGKKDDAFSKDLKIFLNKNGMTGVTFKGTLMFAPNCFYLFYENKKRNNEIDDGSLVIKYCDSSFDLVKWNYIAPIESEQNWNQRFFLPDGKFLYTGWASVPIIMGSAGIVDSKFTENIVKNQDLIVNENGKQKWGSYRILSISSRHRRLYFADAHTIVVVDFDGRQIGDAIPVIPDRKQ